MKKLLLGAFAIWLGLAAAGAAVGAVKFGGGPMLVIFSAVLAVAAWRCWRVATGAVAPAPATETRRPWEQ
jgi:membrane protein implicated in regulation of membrane protease activity